MNFQLYRGNLHKVPDAPRRWPLSKPSIPLQVFKKAIAKREEALLAEQKSRGERDCDPHVLERSEAGVGDDHDEGRKRKREHIEASRMEMEADEDLCRVSERNVRLCAEADHVMTEDMAVDGAEEMACEPPSSFHRAPDVPVKVEGEDADMAGNEIENIVASEDANIEKEGERLEAPRTPAAKDEDCTKSVERTQTREPNGSNPCNEVPSIAKRRAEIQEQLKQLQETKHQLVQILKQVLVSEEESKRKSQGLSAPYAADVPIDQKVGCELQSADLEEGELDYARNPGQPVVASSYGTSQFCDVHPQTLAATPGRHFNYQQSNKP